MGHHGAAAEGAICGGGADQDVQVRCYNGAWLRCRNIEATDVRNPTGTQLFDKTAAFDMQSGTVCTASMYSLHNNAPSQQRAARAAACAAT